MTEEFKIGEIMDSHGVRGEVKVYPTTDSPERFKKIKKATLVRKNGERMIVNFKQVKFFKNLVILKMEEFNDMDEAISIKKAELYVDRDHATPLEEDEYYIADLIGLQVFEENGELLGEVTDILQTGANDVYEVKLEESRVKAPSGNKKPQTVVLLPAIKDCVKKVDVKAGQITVNVLPGLID